MKRDMPRPKPGASAFEPPEVAALLAAADASAAARLAELAAGPDREVAKAARRALFRLRQSGVEVPAEPAPGAASLRVEEDRGLRAIVTNPDGNGRQLVMFEQRDRYGGSPWLLTFLISAGSGIVELYGRKVPRRDIEESLQRLREEDERLLVDIDPDYAIQLVREGEALGRELGNPVPQGYSELMQRIGLPRRTWDRALVYDLIDADALKDDLSVSRDPKKLFELPGMRGWIVSLTAVRQWIERIFEVANSPLELTDQQRDERFGRVIDEAADKMLTEEGPQTYRRLLEEAALVLELSGQHEGASQALYHAVSLEDGKAASGQPFLRAIAERSVYIAAAIVLEDLKKHAPPESEGVVERE